MRINRQQLTPWLRLKPWHAAVFAALLILRLTAQQAPQAPPAQHSTDPTHGCPDAPPYTLGPVNPQGQPWERADEDGGLGYCDTPVIPGQKWRVHDIARPQPRVVDPGPQPEKPAPAPSDAVVLLDGTEATYQAHWLASPRFGGRGGRGGAPGGPPPAPPVPSGPPEWKFENGYITATVGSAGITSKETFSGPLQIHVEWASNPLVVSKGQFRGNSGIMIMGRYEMQVLDSYHNQTYNDGTAGAIYGALPPLVNASRKPGEWQTYDFIWEPPDFEHLHPAYVTIIHNGVVVQNHQALLGPPAHRRVPTYSAHPAEGPISLQNHGERVNPLFRSIWVRKLGNYDER
jgi:hypothetical protein